MPRSPSEPCATTSSTSPEKIASSALTISQCTLMPICLDPRSELLRLLGRFLDRADHVERLLGQVIVLAGDDALEACDRVLDRHVLPGAAGEHLGDEEGLRQEALDLARS